MGTRNNIGMRSGISISFSHSKSDLDRRSGIEKKSPKPDVWRSKCSTDTLVQLGGAPAKYFCNRSSIESRPSSTSSMIAAAVNGFVSDANSKILCSQSSAQHLVILHHHPL